MCRGPVFIQPLKGQRLLTLMAYFPQEKNLVAFLTHGRNMSALAAGMIQWILIAISGFFILFVHPILFFSLKCCLQTTTLGRVQIWIFIEWNAKSPVALTHPLRKIFRSSVFLMLPTCELFSILDWWWSLWCTGIRSRILYLSPTSVPCWANI